MPWCHALPGAPSAPVSLLPSASCEASSFLSAGASYIACLTDNQTGLADSIIQFPSRLPQNMTEEACGAHCFAAELDYGSFSEDGHCLCGVALEPNASANCLPFCAEPHGGLVCDGPSLVSSVFPTQLPVSFPEPPVLCSLYQSVALTVSVPIPVSSLQWDFGDQAGSVNSTKTSVLHTYASPGRYSVTAAVFVGHRSASAQTDVTVVVPPVELELQCPSVAKTNQSLRLQIRNRGGTGLSVEYSITAQDREPGRGELRLHPGATGVRSSPPGLWLRLISALENAIDGSVQTAWNDAILGLGPLPVLPLCRCETWTCRTSCVIFPAALTRPSQ